MPGRSGRHVVGFAIVATLGLLAVGCSSDEGGGSVDVTLQEFAIIPSTSSVGAGEVTFNVTNEGPEDTHEFVVFDTDLAPDALPTAEDGSVNEEAEGIGVVDEIEDIAVGDSPSLTVSLDPGNYVLVCNIYDETEQESHYQEGMRVAFTVE